MKNPQSFHAYFLFVEVVYFRCNRWKWRLLRKCSSKTETFSGCCFTDCWRVIVMNSSATLIYIRSYKSRHPQIPRYCPHDIVFWIWHEREQHISSNIILLEDFYIVRIIAFKLPDEMTIRKLKSCKNRIKYDAYLISFNYSEIDFKEGVFHYWNYLIKCF